MNRRHLVHYLARPSAWPHAIWRKIYELKHPDHPWLDPAAIALLESVLTPQSGVLEWGSGRSTAWLARRVGRLTSVEHNPAWYEHVGHLLAEGNLTNVDLRLVPIPERVSEDFYWSENAYVMVCAEFQDGSFDLVLVDGAMRQNCVARVLPKIRPGGLLVIDNARQLPRLDQWGVPTDWQMIHVGRRRLLDTAVWQRPRTPPECN